MRDIANHRASVQAGESLRVLVVDDDPIFRSVVSAKLSQIATHVAEAADGIAAWDIVAREPYHLVLVDLEMPNMKGVELIRCIRGHPRTRHVPVVVITSRNDSEAVRSSLDAGATSFMTKPINWSMFANHIGYLLRLHSSAERGRHAEARLHAAASGLAALADRLRAELEPSSTLLLMDAGVALEKLKQGADAPDLAEVLDRIVRETAKLHGQVQAVVAACDPDGRHDGASALGAGPPARFKAAGM